MGGTRTHDLYTGGSVLLIPHSILGWATLAQAGIPVATFDNPLFACQVADATVWSMWKGEHNNGTQIQELKEKTHNKNYVAS